MRRKNLENVRLDLDISFKLNLRKSLLDARPESHSLGSSAGSKSMGALRAMRLAPEPVTTRGGPATRYPEEGSPPNSKVGDA